MTEDVQGLLKRVEKLEKGNRKLKAVVSLMLCAVLAVFLVGATKWDKEVVTENLKIVDEKGNIRVLLGLSGGLAGPQLIFYDLDGKSRMEMDLVNKSPDIAFFDPDGNLVLGMGLVFGEPRLLFYESNGKIIRSLP